MKIAIGSDHAGFLYKQELIDFLIELKHEVKDYGTHSDQSVDYPDYVHPLSLGIKKEEQELGILICGSANGVAMTANKHQDIRAAICWNEEVAILARQHNNANIVCIPARFISMPEAKKVITAFINSTFEGGRHQTRVRKINC
ncbi:MAG: ribose 5-phosphate isomerase B [Sphingobacteriales bacterium]|jgi:ribose 5-phosphate isomerase B